MISNPQQLTLNCCWFYAMLEMKVRDIAEIFIYGKGTTREKRPLIWKTIYLYIDKEPNYW